MATESVSKEQATAAVAASANIPEARRPTPAEVVAVEEGTLAVAAQGTAAAAVVEAASRRQKHTSVVVAAAAAGAGTAGPAADTAAAAEGSAVVAAAAEAAGMLQRQAFCSRRLLHLVAAAAGTRFAAGRQAALTRRPGGGTAPAPPCSVSCAARRARPCGQAQRERRGTRRSGRAAAAVAAAEVVPTRAVVRIVAQRELEGGHLRRASVVRAPHAEGGRTQAAAGGWVEQAQWTERLSSLGPEEGHSTSARIVQKLFIIGRKERTTEKGAGSWRTQHSPGSRTRCTRRGCGP